MFVGLSEPYLTAMASIWLVLLVAAATFIKLRPRIVRQPLLVVALRAFLAAWTATFVLVALETGFVLLYDATDSYNLAKVSQRWYARHVRLNNWGYRDDVNYTERIPAGRRRITFLGDSFTLGHGVADVENRFVNRIRKRVDTTAPNHWQVYLLAQGGLDTRGQLTLLGDLARRGFATDVLVLVYCLNDVETLHENNRIIMGTILLTEPKNWLTRHAYLPNLLYYRLRHFGRPEVVGYFDWLADAYRGEIWTRQQAQLDAVRQWCRENRCDLVVVVFPFLHQLDADYPFAQAHRALGEYFSLHGVPYLDLLETMMNHRAEGLVVNRFDAHPNERAHALAADAIWRGLLADRASEAMAP
jgi:hypothetical protein